MVSAKYVELNALSNKYLRHDISWLLAIAAAVIFLAWFEIRPVYVSAKALLFADRTTTGTVLDTQSGYKSLGTVRYQFVVGRTRYTIQDNRAGSYESGEKVRVKYCSSDPLVSYLDDNYIIIVIYKGVVCGVFIWILGMAVSFEAAWKEKKYIKLEKIYADREAREADKRKRFMEQ